MASYSEVGNNNIILVLRLLEYENVNSAANVYDSISDPINATFTTITGLPPNFSGQKGVISNRTLYSISFLVNSSVITASIFYPSNQNVPSSLAVSVLLNAVNTTARQP
ncbi:MAG: hypothetical protein QW144_01385 [Candidatus Micrarchaeaceae archaeon]